MASLDPSLHHLLTLPPEIRGVIYENLLSGANKYILSPCSRPTYCYSDLDLHPGPRYQENYSYAHPAANLLLTCHQLRREVQRAMVQHVHLYCSMSEVDILASAAASASPTFIPHWLRLSLRHLSLYSVNPTRGDPIPVRFSNPFTPTRPSSSTPSPSPTPSSPSSHHSHSSSSSASSNFQDTYTRRLLVEHTSPAHASLVRTFPALENLNFVYFWPEILRRIKGPLEQYFTGKRDDQLVSLVRMAFRMMDPAPGDVGAAGVVDRDGKVVLPPPPSNDRAVDGAVDGGSDVKNPHSRVRVSVTGHFTEVEPEKRTERRCLCIRYDVPSYEISGRWVGNDYDPPCDAKLGWHPHE